MADRTLVRFTDRFNLVLTNWTTPITAGNPFATRTISANSLYNNIGGGRNSIPSGVDQWAGFYRKYLVNYSKIRVTPVGWRGTTTVPFRLTIMPMVAQAFDNLAKPDELPYSRTRMFSGALYDSTVETNEYTLPPASNTLSGVRNQCYIKKIAGQTRISNDDAYWAIIQNAGGIPEPPDEHITYLIYAESMVPFLDAVGEEPTVPSNLVLDISITLNTMLGDRRLISDS